MAQSPVQDITILFYNSEANLNNYSTVKAQFDRYLSQFGPFKFQPFSKRDIFEKVVETTKAPRILIVSSGHYCAINKKSPLTPLLIGLRGGKNSFRKILVAKGPSNVHELKGAVVASSGSQESTQSLLREMLGQDQETLVSTMNVLQVPKDIDALLSLDFGLARCAVSTKENLKQMETAMARKSGLIELFESREIMMPIAAVEKSLGRNESLDRLIQVMKDMKASKIGRENLSLLSMDEWMDISPELAGRLEP